MNSPVSENDLRRLADLEPSASVVTGRVRRRVRRHRRRSRIVLTSCLAVMLAIGGVGLWTLSSSSDPDEPVADVPPAPATDPTERSEALPATSCGDPEPSLVVFLALDVTEADSEAVRQYLASIPGATNITYIDQDDAYEEFEALFSDSREMLQSVVPEDLPTSFRAVLAGNDPESVAAVIRPFPGVQDVIVNPCQPGSLVPSGS